jgi:hypothetical protein
MMTPTWMISLRSDRLLLALLGTCLGLQLHAAKILVPMDGSQRDHLKAYGVAFWALQRDVPIDWLLNYRGGSFLLDQFKTVEQELTIRGVTFQVVADGQANVILNEIAEPSANMEVVRLEKAPRIAVYAPDGFQPWDDAVALVMTYAEIPYERIYDQQIIAGVLPQYDWLHLHHEDFTGQYGKFYRMYRNAPVVSAAGAGQ